MSYTRAMDCRYCQRYHRACGRDHTAETQSDWSRDWQGNSTTATRPAYYDPASPDNVNFGCIYCGAQTVTGYDGPGDRRVSHVYDESDPRYLRNGMSECKR